MVKLPVMTEEQTAVVQATKAFEAVLLGDFNDAMGWLAHSPMAWGVFFAMVGRIVDDVPGVDRAGYLQLVKDSAEKHYQVRVF